MPSETIANGTDQIIHRLDLNEYGLQDVPQDQQKQVKQEVADYLANEILRNINRSTSPVKGEGKFKRLEPEYAVRDKAGNRLSNLELEGDLLDSFRVENAEGPYLNVGHLGDQVPKADGHNQLSSKAKSWAKAIKYPRRRYIPDDGQKFVPTITGEITEIIEAYIPQYSEQSEVFAGVVESTTETGDGVEVTNTDFFSDDLIEDLLEDALQRRKNGV